MLDIGMPEFLVIAIVALLVLGPERLPEVMRKGGQWYRQARELMAQYTSEAQRMFDEGMREVEDVSATINSAWDSATSADSTRPPPRLLQLAPPLQQPSSAADAGPWMLPAWHRDPLADREPLPALPATPFALARLAPPEPALNGYTAAGSGASSLIDQAPPEADAPDPDATGAGFVVPEVPEMPALPETPGAPGTSQPPVYANGAGYSNGRAAPVAGPPVGTADGGLGRGGPGEAVREQTVVELYLKGDLTWHKAAEFLELTPEAFLDRVDQARRAARTA